MKLNKKKKKKIIIQNTKSINKTDKYNKDKIIM